MGFLRYNSEIFLFGGSRCNGYLSEDNPDFKPNLEVYEYNSSNGTLQVANYVAKMKGYKRLPMVELVGNKIFVHHLCDPFLLNQRPFFECYHIATGSWKEVPDPDLPAECLIHARAGNNRFVVCNKIFIPIFTYDSNILRCLDTDLETWDETSAKNLVESFSKAELHWPGKGTSFSGLGESRSQHLSLIVSYLERKIYVAQIIDKSGFLLLHQELHLPLFSGYDSQIVRINEHHILDLEDGQHMCFVYSFFLDGQLASQIPPLHALYLCIFEVNLLFDDACNGILLSACNGTGPSPPQCKTFMNPQIKEEFWFRMPELPSDIGTESLQALII